MKKYLALILIFLFIGCGYKPANHYARDIISGRVFVDVAISLEDPKNSVLLKNTLIDILTTKLDTKITNDANEADVKMNVAIDSIKLTELGYDTKGYVKSYRATVTLNITYASKTKTGTTTVSASHDFSLDDNTTISEVKRFEAIKIASDKAMMDFVSKIAILSFQ